MLTLVLSLPLLLQGTPVHADLHPKNADLYLELGDSAVLWPALDQAPLARFLRDADMKALFGALGPYTEGTLQDTLLGLMTQGQADWKAETWFKSLKSVSLSMVALGVESETRAAFGSLAVFDFATPEATKAFEGVLAGMASSVEPHASLSGYQRLSKDKASEEQWSVVAGTRLVLGNTGSLPEDYAARAAKTSEGVAKAELFQKFA